ncbi:nitrate- and nitrite sensing domain-containing protein [Streptomyces sp. RerS4]|uniref:sensor histidine kinase n=1 Tax=Streptomyces sp. RerS4 TaxID=2942449 RepID=UPI00201C729D|nr:nitrate- and nitrite sensing domain-containing protein [Streptomyces sp. RerS4]UQW99398.1 nitrate- and nitrite sensing domain-containing protein [Streptomyces sp. RerS4]
MRLRTLLILLAVVPTVAMGAQVAVTAERLLEQADHLRADLATSKRIGEPLYRLMVALQAERKVTAARWAGAPVRDSDLRERRAATDQAAAEFRRLATEDQAESPQAAEQARAVKSRLDRLAAFRSHADARNGVAAQTMAYYNDVIDGITGLYQGAFSHADDAGLVEESRPVVAMISAGEMLARQDTILTLAGPSRELTPAAFGEFLSNSGSHRHLYDTWIVPYLPAGEKQTYERITTSDAWKTKLRVENAIVAQHKITDSGMKLPADVGDWPAAHQVFATQLAEISAQRSRDLLVHADANASELETELYWLVGGSAGGLLLVVGVVVLTTRSVLRRLRGLHERTVAIADETLPDIVARLHRGRPVDDEVLPKVSGDQDEVGRINDAFARVVAVSVDGHRQLAAERHGFGMFASGIASRTGNLVSRQLSLTEDIQDTFGHDEALLAELMRSDQLTVGMRRQIENLLILSGGEIPDPHTEPMRVADLLREAAAEVEDFRRIERHALDEASVEPSVISQISHLLAELLDNATRFSPPRSKVVIRAELVADGLSVEIEDRGPRVGTTGYEEMNRRLHSAPPYSELAENAHRLGLFVVGHLADQLKAKVTLRRSVFGGTSAVVILPRELLVSTAAPAAAVTPESAAPAPIPLPVQPAPVSPGPPRALAERPVPVAVPVLAPRTPVLRPVTGDGGARPGGARPALPERVPQTHMTRQLLGPRAPEPGTGTDTATPEEVADAWADYEEGTQKVEAELRQEQDQR